MVLGGGPEAGLPSTPAPVSQVVLVVKNPPANTGDIREAGSIPGLRRSPGVGNGNPLQYSCWDNPMDRGARQATVCGVAKSWSAEAKVFFLGLPPTRMMH